MIQLSGSVEEKYSTYILPISGGRGVGADMMEQRKSYNFGMTLLLLLLVKFSGSYRISPDLVSTISFHSESSRRYGPDEIPI